MSSGMTGDKEDLDDVALLEEHARRTSCGVYLAVCLFGMAGTLSCNALWIMVPVSGHQVPENHRLPQYLVALLQLGNISGAVFLLTRRCSARGPVHEAPAIYLGLAVSVVAMATMAAFWERDTIVYGQFSVIYLVAAFCISQVTCLAALTHLPFVARLKAAYVTALLLGEALAALLPHTLAIAEGISTPPECDVGSSPPNGSYVISGWRTRFQPTTTIKPAIPPQLRFDPSFYFFAMTGVLAAAALSFLALRCIPSVRFEYDQIQVDCMEEVVELGHGGGGGGGGGGGAGRGGGGGVGIEDDLDGAWQNPSSGEGVGGGGGHTNSALHHSSHRAGTSAGAGAGAGALKPVILDDGSIKQPFARTQPPSRFADAPGRRAGNSYGGSTRAAGGGGSVHAPQHALSVDTKPSESCLDLAPSFCLLMLITLWTSLFLFGPLSSIKAHGCLPIGNNTFVAGTLLTSLTPIVVIIVGARVTSDSKVTLVVAFTSLGTILLTYFVALIAFSHESASKEDSPIFQNNGELLTTVAWVAITGLFTYARITIAVILRDANKETMIWFAGVTQVGATVGTLCMVDGYSICRVYRNYLQIICDAEWS